jgi:ribonuclease H2 subunit A
LLFSCVSAASICAKVARDKVLKDWIFPESKNCPEAVRTNTWGSGYPGDAITKKFLRDNLNPGE